MRLMTLTSLRAIPFARRRGVVVTSAIFQRQLNAASHALGNNRIEMGSLSLFLGARVPNLTTLCQRFRETIPNFPKFQTIYEEDELGSLSATGFEYTELRTNPTYIVTYVMWYR